MTPSRTIRLVGQQQVAMIAALLPNLPVDGTIEVIIREYHAPRKREQNEAQWAGMLGDFASHAWVRGKQHSAEVWHAHLKDLFLPDEYTEGITLDGYLKWIETPCGKLIMVGSTTRLTIKGMAQYMKQCHAYGSTELGIRFSTKEID